MSFRFVGEVSTNEIDWSTTRVKHTPSSERSRTKGFPSVASATSALEYLHLWLCSVAPAKVLKPLPTSTHIMASSGAHTQRTSHRQRRRLHRHRQRRRQRQRKILCAIEGIRRCSHRLEATVLDAAVLCSTDLGTPSLRPHRSERSGSSDNNSSGPKIAPGTFAKGEGRSFPPVGSVSGPAGPAQNLKPRQSRPQT